jgi:membrane protein DedA with SNARE-associated domain
MMRLALAATLFGAAVVDAGADSAPFAIAAALVVATLVSEDLACLTAGTLASQGRIGFGLAVAACAFGIFVGDLMLYGAGRAFGSGIVESRLFGRFVSREKLAAGRDWLGRNGRAAVLLSRFTFGLRLPIYVAAGALRVNFVQFAAYFALAVAVWTPIIVGLSYLVGEQAVRAGLFGPSSQIAILAVIVALFFVIRTAARLATHKGRRFAVGRLKRIAYWEFWPLQVFYAPVVLFVGWLALRHRSLAVISAVNPGIEASGLIGESKHSIYEMLRRSPAAVPHLLDHVELRAGDEPSARAERARAFASARTFPIVAKPDAGERGKGVRLLKDESELQEFLAGQEGDHLLQEFAGGIEASLFYYRFPGAPAGRVLSMTEKRFPEVVGDGTSTLEELILDDPRAVCLAGRSLERNRARLGTVPAPGEAVAIVDIGTHSQGAVFLDGEHLLTPELERRIDEICVGCDGFNFGRFDLRAASFDDLRGGSAFRIVELNGVTSESTNIYDPKYSIVDAYRILFGQWAIAFRIGAENVRRGAAPHRLGDLVRLVGVNVCGGRFARFFGPRSVA